MTFEYRNSQRMSSTVGQPAGVVACGESADLSANVGKYDAHLSQHLTNWGMHNIKMAPFRRTVEQFVRQKRIPECKNFAEKKSTILSRKGEEIEVTDPWSYCDGKKQHFELAIQSWAAYNEAFNDFKFTWGQMEGARRALWHFLEQWIKPHKSSSLKRSIIFGTCFMFLSEVTRRLRGNAEPRRQIKRQPSPTNDAFDDECIVKRQRISYEEIPAPEPRKIVVSQLSIEALSYALEDLSLKAQSASISEESPMEISEVVPILAEEIERISFEESVRQNMEEWKRRCDEEMKSPEDIVEEEEGIVAMSVEEEVEISNFEVDMAHLRRLRKQTIEEMTERLKVADPYNLCCKCWSCVERFIRRNPFSIHNQINMIPTECKHSYDFVDRTARARESHRKRCAEVILQELPEYMMCSHETVDWANSEIMYEDAGRAQAEEVLEASESIEKSQNITFVDERPVDRASMYLGASTKTRDVNNDISETQWNLTNVLDREIPVSSFTWSVTDDVFKQIVSLPFPKCYTDKKNNMGYNMLRSLGFLRADAHFRIQLNGNRFNQGRLACFLLPLTWAVDKDRLSSRNFSNLAHIFIDASVSNSGVLDMPFTHLLSHFCVKQNLLEDDSMSCLCTLVIVVLNKLRAGEGAPSTLHGTVYAKLGRPTVHQVCWPSDAFSFDNTTGLVAQGENMWERAAATGVGQALGNVLKLMTGGLATGVGNWLGGLIFDRPLDPHPVQPVLNRSIQPFCHGAGPDSSVRMALSPISQTETSPDMVASNFKDMNFQSIIGLDQYLYSGEITTSTSVGTTLFRFPCCPTYIPKDEIEENTSFGTRYRPTALAYVCRSFVYYRGALKFKIQFIDSQFHSMRIMLVFNPLDDGVKEPLSMEEAMNLNCAIFDIQEKKEVEFLCPYTSTRPWLRCDHFRSDANFFGPTKDDGVNRESLNRSAFGTFSMYLLNSLVAPENVSQTIDFNVFISAGEDFEFAVPAPLFPLRLTPAYITFRQVSNFPYYFKDSAGFPPAFVGNSGDFENRHLIENLYRCGRNFYEEGRIDLPDNGYWWECAPILQAGFTPDVLFWKQQVGLLSGYSETSIQKQFMKSLLPYPNKWRLPTDPWAYPRDKDSFRFTGDPGLKVQAGVEVNTTNRENNAEVIIPTKGYTTGEAAPSTIAENAQNLQTVLRRFYPIYESEPIYNTYGSTLVTIPVSPTGLTNDPKPYNGQMMHNRILHPIAYFSRLFNYWRGSLRFKVVITSHRARKVTAFYDPRTCVNFRCTSGVSQEYISHKLSLASVMMVNSLQGSLELEVPYESAYNQLLIELDEDLQDLRSQNGTLYVTIDNVIPDSPYTTDPLRISVFMSTGDDFVLNLYRGPTYVYEVSGMVDNHKTQKKTCVRHPEIQYSVRTKDWGDYPGCYLGRPGYPKEGGVAHMSADFGDCTYQTYVEEHKGEFDESGIKFKAAQMMTNLATIVEEEECEMFDEFLTDDALPTIQGVFSRVREVGQNVLDASASMKNILKNIEETKACENIGALLARTNSLTQNVGDYTTGAITSTIAKYSVLSAEILTVGAFIYSLRECLQAPVLKNFIMLAITCAGCIGFAVSNALQSVIANVVDWALNSQLPRAQALDGATADIIENHSGLICSVVAVIGTVFYAYIFDVLPSMTTLKECLKNLFGDDTPPKAKAQAGLLNLRGAHFSLMGLNALDKVYNKCLEYVSQFLDWVLDRENPEVIAARTTREYQERIMRCVNELDLLENEEFFTAAMHDPFVHNRFYFLQGEVNDLTTISLRERLDSRVNTLISECRKRCQKVIRDLERDSPKPLLRYDPVCIVLSGPSGTGKTKLMHKIASIIKEEMDLPEYNLVYPKGIKDEFWSGYKNQPIVFWDEFGQSRKMDEVVPEFMTLRGSTPVMLNMAALNDKGKYFTSQAIIKTTNVPYENFNAVRDNVAYKRRRHVLIRMTHREGFNAINMQNARHDQFPNWEHCEFAIMNPLRDNVIRGGMQLHQVLGIIRTRVRRWHQNQVAILNANDVPVEMPRGIVPIDNQEFAEEQLAALAAAEEEAMADIEEDHVRNEEILQDENLLERDIEEIARELLQNNLDARNAPDPPPLVAHAVNDDEVPIGNYVPIDLNEVDDEDEDEELFYDAIYHRVGCMCVHCRPRLEAKPWTREEIQRIYANCKIQLFDVAKDFKDAVTVEMRSFIRRAKTFCLVNKLRAQNLWIKAKNIFSEIRDECMAIFRNVREVIYNFIDNNPRIAKVIGALTLFTGVGGVLYAFGNSHSKSGAEGAYESGPIRAPRARNIVEGSYESGPTHAPRARLTPEGIYETGIPHVRKWRAVADAQAELEVQGSEDPVAMDIRKKVHPYMCVIKWLTARDKLCLKLRCLRVGGSLILAPFHFFQRRQQGDRFTILHRFQWLEFDFDPAKMYRDADRDWVLYDLGFRVDPSQHLFKYFISERNLVVRKCRGILCSVDDDGAQVINNGPVEGAKYFSYLDNYDTETFKQYGWRVEIPTSAGDCGSILVGISKAIEAPGKILGVHVAGYDDQSLGYSVLVTRELLESVARRAGLLVNPPPNIQAVDSSVPLEKFKILPDGDFTIVGQMHNKKRVFQPCVSDLRLTPWSDSLDIENPKKPAYLMPFINEAGERISPLLKALPKFGKESVPLPTRSLSKIENFLKDYLVTKLNQHTGKRIFDLKEAVLGIPGIEFAERLNMKSSPGWPYQVEDRKGPGKFKYFGDEGEILDNVLLERIEERIVCGKKGLRVGSIWRDCLKDELRPIKKVNEGKTRLFNVAPLDFTLVVRQYFFDFVIAFYNAGRSDFFSAVGIDPESIDWTFLYNRLREKSQQTIAGDYSGFDGGMKPEVIELMSRLINHWYGDEVENQNLRHVLFNEMCHTYHLVNDCVYISHQGNKSGNPLTVIVNTLANMIYCMCAWIDIYPDKPIEEFMEECTAIIYGDDIVMTVGRKAPLYNQNSLTKTFAKFGIKFTNESKQDGVMSNFRDLDEVTFLKRGFRRDAEVGKTFILPVMAEETLHSFLFWYRKTEGGEEDQLRANMRAALDFAFFHGRKFYERYNILWKEKMRESGFTPLSTSYEEQLDRFLHKNGALGELCPAQAAVMDNFMSVTNNKWTRRLCGIYESLFYYTCAGFNFNKSKHVVEDDRWAVSIPSGEGKSFLCSQYPDIFVDHDDLLIPHFKNTSKLRLDRLPWRSKIAREIDFPREDRRILLVHSPANTKRNLVGCFITPKPTYIRINVFHRLLQDRPEVMEFDERNVKLLEIARLCEPSLFCGDT